MVLLGRYLSVCSTSDHNGKCLINERFLACHLKFIFTQVCEVQYFKLLSI